MKERQLSIAQKLILFSDRVRNRQRLWQLKNHDQIASMRPESLSELDDYLTLCKLSATEEKFFAKFRSCKSYRAILENVDGVAGEDIVKVMTDYGAEPKQFTNLWHAEIGNPYKYHIRGIGYVAPTELRYSKIIVELEILFGRLDGFSITEIGVGFGGQGGQILSRFDVAQYEFIDLPEPLMLVNRYLTEIGLKEKAKLTPPKIVAKNQRDLIISNYAFSELNSELQEYYFENVIKDSKRGFVIYNHITPDDYGTLTAQEFANKIPGSEIFRENPLSHPGNVLIAWGHSGKLHQQ